MILRAYILSFFNASSPRLKKKKKADFSSKNKSKNQCFAVINIFISKLLICKP